MNECSLNKKGIAKVTSSIKNIRTKLDLGKISNTEAKNLLKSLINSYKEYKDPSVVINTALDKQTFDESVLAAISVAAKNFGFLGSTEYILNENALRALFFQETGDSLQKPTGNQTTDLLRSIKEVPYEKDSKGEFLVSSYGRASRVRLKAEQQMRVSFVNSILIDRRDDINEPRVINNDIILNLKIRNLKELMYKTIINAVDAFARTAKGAPINIDKFKSKTVFIKTLNGDYAYTGVIEEMEKSPIFSMFRPENLGENGADTLIALDQDLDLKYLLDGYNAYLFLKHFDEYFYMKYGKIVSFDAFGKRTGDNVYHFITKGTNNVTTWKDSDEIDLAKECPLAVLEIINTTRLFEFGKNYQKTINGNSAYLKFSDLSHVIGKIKDLVFNIPDIDWNAKSGNRGKTYLDRMNLSESTETTAKGYTLHQLINRIRLNPLKYLSAIFEILSSLSAIDELTKLNLSFAQAFSKEDRDIIYSLHKEVFSPNGNSINNISREDPINNYYSWVTLVCDSISLIHFLQYYLDNGILKVRNMSDTRLDSLNKTVRQVIRVINSKKANGDFAKFKENFQGGLLKFEVTNSGIEFIKKFGDNYLKVIVNNDGKVTSSIMATAKNGTELVNSNKTLEAKNTMPGLLEFLSSVIGLNIDLEFLNIMSSVSNLKLNPTLDSLVDLASRTIFLRYVSQEILKNITSEDKIRSTLQTTLGIIPKYDKTLGELDTIHDSDTNTIEHIAKTLAYQLGLYSSNLIKSGNGNSQSQYSLSRLLGNLAAQMDLQCKAPSAVMNDAFLIKNPNVFKGVYTAREFYSLDLVQDHTNFTSSEFVHSEIICDFLGGLIPLNKITGGLVGNGTIALLPSVNSDKNTIGRILIDTTLKIDTPIEGIRENIAIKDLNDLEWRIFIAHELGNSYLKVHNNILNDYKKLLSWDGYKSNTPGQTVTYRTLFSRDMYVNGFRDLNNFVNTTYGGTITPILFIQDLCAQYNEAHRNNPIHLTDQIHFLGKKNLEANQTLLSYLYRFQTGPFDPNLDPDGLIRKEFAYYNPDGTINNSSGYVSNEDFWKIKESEIFKSLIKSRFQLDTLNRNQPEIAYITDTSSKGYYGSLEECKKWIDFNPSGSSHGHTGLLVLGYLDGKKIFSKADLNGLDITDSKVLLLHNFELNPLFKLYNYMDYLFTLEFMLSTVGSCIAHPSKMKGKLGVDYTVLEEEAGRFQAQHKRNVSFTAAMQEFLLGLLNGIPTLYNISILDDIRDLLYNVSGNIDEVKPFDGATFVNPFVTYLENNSLNGAKAGITKKLFVHFYDERTGNGGIIKTCGFGLTNDWIRNSKLLLRMMWKMTKRTWLNEDGTEFKTDITKDYRGQNIKYGDIYYKRDGDYYKVIPSEIEVIRDADGNLTNLYIIKEHKLAVKRIQGQLGVSSFEELAIKPNDRVVTINSNYTLWQAFGGMNALEVQNGTSLVPSESSITRVVDAMNNIGVVKNDDVRTQDDLYLPLKHSDIHYCPTIGAVKQGAANVNGASTYYDDKDYTFMKINLNQIGIQLDKEHHADGEELSLMTLVISACAHKGYTGDVANKIYAALHTLTEIGTHDILLPVLLYFEVFKNTESTDEEKQKATDEIKEAVINTVIKAMSRESMDETSLLHTLAGELLKKARDGQHLRLREDIKGNLPIDNPLIYRLFLSKLSVFLTNSGIKAKIPGLLSVLTPSHLLMKIHSRYITDVDGNIIESAIKPEAVQNHIDDNGNPVTEEGYLEQLQQETPKVLAEDGTIHYHNLKLNRLYLIHHNLPEFTYASYVDNRLAQTSNGLITFRYEPVSVDEFFTYITGQDGSPTGLLKAVVFQRLQLKGYSLDYLHKLIQNPDDVRAAILWHEQAHKEKPPKNYYKYEKEHGIIYNSKDPNYDATKVNWLAEEKVEEELRATLVGLEKLEQNKNLKTYMLRTAKDRHYLRLLILQGKINFCQEYIKDGRDLGEYDAQFFGSDGQEYSLYDLDSVLALFELKDCLDGKGSNLYDFLLKYKHILNSNAYLTFEEVEKPLRSIVRRDTAMLSKYGKLFYLNYDQGIVYIDGLPVQVDRSRAINIIPYEIIAPKANAANFGLRKYDSIDDILSNPDFFFERMLENFGTRINREHCFDIELKRMSNRALTDNPKKNHIYLLSRDNLVGRNPAARPWIAEELLKIEPLVEIIDGKRYRVDANGEPIYELNEGDEIYQEIASGTEIIVSDDLQFYLERLQYTLPRISDYYYLTKSGLFKNYEHLISAASKKNKAAKKWTDFIFKNSILRDEEGNEIKTEDGKLLFITDPLNKPETNALLYGDLLGNYNDNPNAPLFLYLHNLSKEIYSSFTLSLECVASRTPSQSMQSFMPMRIVAFDNPDVNTAYVSTAQIWLLGSDYRTNTYCSR